MSERPPKRELAALDALILAGGLGTRLVATVPECPKALAPVAGRPFIDLMLDRLVGHGVRRVILCLGHRAAPIVDHVRRRNDSGIDLQWVVEAEPAGTAGAIANAQARLRSDPVLVMNGDTHLPADLEAFARWHREQQFSVSMVCVRVADASRFGTVTVSERDRVGQFREKSGTPEPSWINGGIYLLARSVIDGFSAAGAVSLEHDVLGRMPANTIGAYRTDAPFVDIGTPEGYALAQSIDPHLSSLAGRTP